MTDHGIPPRDHFRVVTKYQLGVVIEPVSDDDDEKRFTGMLCTPYLTPNGCRAIRFRNLQGGKPKIAQPKDQKNRLYNPAAYFEAVRTGNVIGLTEGEPDAWAASEVLGIPSMGIPGANAWTDNRRIWAPLFKNFGKVLIFQHGDKEQTRIRPDGEEETFRPGEELSKAIKESLKWRARIVRCPEGEDVASMVAAGRADELTKQFGTDDEDE